MYPSLQMLESAVGCDDILQRQKRYVTNLLDAFYAFYYFSFLYLDLQTSDHEKYINLQ